MHGPVWTVPAAFSSWRRVNCAFLTCERTVIPFPAFHVRSRCRAGVCSCRNFLCWHRVVLASVTTDLYACLADHVRFLLDGDPMENETRSGCPAPRSRDPTKQSSWPFPEFRPQKRRRLVRRAALLCSLQCRAVAGRSNLEERRENGFTSKYCVILQHVQMRSHTPCSQ
jgi:hypothetical protein